MLFFSCCFYGIGLNTDSESPKAVKRTQILEPGEKVLHIHSIPRLTVEPKIISSSMQLMHPEFGHLKAQKK